MQYFLSLQGSPLLLVHFPLLLWYLRVARLLQLQSHRIYWRVYPWAVLLSAENSGGCFQTVMRLVGASRLNDKMMWRFRQQLVRAVRNPAQENAPGSAACTLYPAEVFLYFKRHEATFVYIYMSASDGCFLINPLK